MNPEQQADAGLILAALIVNLPFLAYLVTYAVHKLKGLPMPDFSALNTAAAGLTTAADSVAAYVPTLNDASTQTSIDSATAAITAATATLTAILPAPAAPEAPQEGQ